MRRSAAPAYLRAIVRFRRLSLSCLSWVKWDSVRYARGGGHNLGHIYWLDSIPLELPHPHMSCEQTGPPYPTGYLLRNIFASVAEYEREMIRERLVAGLRKAKASGKHVGRPRTVVSRRRIEQLRGKGMSWRKIARCMQLPKSTLYRYRGVHQVELTAC